MRLAVSLVGIAVGMAMMAYASVPLYRLFCQVTGVGGTTQTAVKAPEHALDRRITVRFNTDVASDLPWSFRSEQKDITVPIGKQTLVSFVAKNNGSTPITGTATYNVTPYAAGPYFDKVQCFCFNKQTIAPGATVHFPVSFFVDPAIMNDPNARDIDTITLSDTFFKVEPS
jgi:cytochrome c oxidase assembly protein subunit 11